MPKLIIQTENAIKAMIASGFKRSEFTAQTKKDRYGMWGMPTIYVKSEAKGKILEFKHQLAENNFDVQIFNDDNGFVMAQVSYTYRKGKIETYNIDAIERHNKKLREELE